MAEKLVSLGRAGSGKTTAARHVVKLAQGKGCSALHFNDYDILRAMFQADDEHKMFRPTEHNGFDVLDFSVLDTALQVMEKNVRECMSSVELVTIEFSRYEYCTAIKHFSTAIIMDAIFIYIDKNLV